MQLQLSSDCFFVLQQTGYDYVTCSSLFCFYFFCLFHKYLLVWRSYLTKNLEGCSLLPAAAPPSPSNFSVSVLLSRKAEAVCRLVSWMQSFSMKGSIKAWQLMVKVNLCFVSLKVRIQSFPTHSPSRSTLPDFPSGLRWEDVGIDFIFWVKLFLQINENHRWLSFKIFGVIVKLVSFLKQTERFNLCGHYSTVTLFLIWSENVDFTVDSAQ